MEGDIRHESGVSYEMTDDISMSVKHSSELYSTLSEESGLVVI